MTSARCWRRLGAPVGDRDKPLCVIANTIKGKGVSFMENKAKWHHGVPNDAAICAGNGGTWSDGATAPSR